MSEKFCLRWNDFETSLSSAFKDIREERDFFDVTLACGNDQIQAHKVILSACSPFFRNILRRNIHEHPLLYMKDISMTNLDCVLNFMYHGEVSVAQEDLNSFLATAEELEVKGLTQTNDKETKALRLRRTDKSRPPAVSNNSHQNNSKSDPPQLREDDDIQEIVPIKTEPTSVMAGDTVAGGVVAMAQEEQQEVYEDTGEYGDYGYEETGESYSCSVEDGIQDQRKVISSLIWERIVKLGTGQYQCTECGIIKTSSGLTALKNHVESKHLTNLATYTCPHCSKVLATSNAYNQHLQVHKIR